MKSEILPANITHVSRSVEVTEELKASNFHMLVVEIGFSPEYYIKHRDTTLSRGMNSSESFRLPLSTSLVRLIILMILDKMLERRVNKNPLKLRESVRDSQINGGSDPDRINQNFILTCLSVYNFTKCDVRIGSIWLWDSDGAGGQMWSFERRCFRPVKRASELQFLDLSCTDLLQTFIICGPVHFSESHHKAKLVSNEFMVLAPDRYYRPT